MEELPENWEMADLGDTCQLINGDRGKNYPSKDKLCHEGIPFVNAGHLENSKIDKEGMNFVNEDRYNLLNSGKFILNDILYCIRGSLGKLALNDYIEKGAIASSLIIVRPFNEIDPKYALYYLSSPLADKMIAKFDNGTAQPNLSGADLGRFSFPISPFNEQKRVVDKIEELFSELDKGIESLKAAGEQLKVYRQAVLKHAFEGRLTTDWREENRIEESWKKVPLKDVIEEPKYGTSKKCDYETNGIGVLRIPNIASGVIDSADLKFAQFDKKEIETYSLCKGDILTIRSNGSISLVGKCALVGEQDKEFLYAGYLIRIRPNADKVQPEFLLNVLSSHGLRSQIEQKAKSTSGVNNINAKEIKSLVVPICNINEQKRIVEILEERLSEVDRVEGDIEYQLKKAEVLRQSILKQAFSGKLVAQDPNDEPASVLLERIKSQEVKNQRIKKGKAA